MMRINQKIQGTSATKHPTRIPLPKLVHSESFTPGSIAKQSHERKNPNIFVKKVKTLKEQSQLFDV